MSDSLRARIEARVVQRRVLLRGGSASVTPPRSAPARLRRRPDPAHGPRLRSGYRSHASYAPHSRYRSHSRYRPRSRYPPLPVRLVAGLLVALLASLALRLFVVETFWIPSASMEPTLHGCRTCNDDRVLVDKLSYRLHAVHRGDVVVFTRPPASTAAERHLVKRVIGLPGETVSGHDRVVWIGGRPLAESYAAAGCGGTADFAAVTVPSGQVFVLGDNRCDSADSRSFGPIPESTIIGRAFVVFWPLGRLHWL